MCRLWQRVFGDPVPMTLDAEVEEYLTGEGAYFTMKQFWDRHVHSAEVRIHKTTLHIIHLKSF